MFEWIVRQVRRDWEETASWPLPAQRAVFARKFYPAPHVKRVTVRTGVIDGVPVRHFIPPSPGATRIVFFHGGSYIYGSTETSHAEICAHVAFATSLEVIGVEYRLAPEHPWPAQLDDALKACRAMGDSPLILAGDSAGGHLAVRVSNAIKPRALVLLSPWADLEMPGRSWVENATYEIGTRDVLVRHALGVAGTLPLSSFALVNDPLAGLPPTFVSVGDAEGPRDDALRFVEALRTQRVDCTLHVAQDMPHNPTLFAGFHPSGKAAFDAAVSFIRTHAG